MISVIIPVYNVEQYLKECVDSVINQTYRDLEIILVDDGSTDNSGKLCNEYEKRDSRIKVIHKENGGLSSARNAGIEVAQGEYFSFIDSDDYIMDNMLEQLLYALEKSNSDISVCTMTSDVNELEKKLIQNIIVYTKEKALELILREKKLLTSAPCKLYKREFFDDVRYPDGILYEDYGTTYKLVHEAERVAFVNVPKYYYRHNPNSITKSEFSYRRLDYYKMAEDVKRFVGKEYPQLLKYAVSHSVRMSIAFIRQVSAAGLIDDKLVTFLTKDIKKNIFGYLFSDYTVLSKMYGLLICISPKMALKVFNKKRK